MEYTKNKTTIKRGVQVGTVLYTGTWTLSIVIIRRYTYMLNNTALSKIHNIKVTTKRNAGPKTFHLLLLLYHERV